MYKLGIDIGGTNVKGIALGEENDVIFKTKLPTRDTGDEEWKKKVDEVFLLLKEKVGLPFSLGISAPGLADPHNTSILHMPGRLKGLTDLDWGNYLGTPCKVLNDAHAATLAEYHFGVGKGSKHLIMLTLGTGVGGGLIIDGQLHQGELGRAGHLGHIAVRRSDSLDITGTPGSLEDAVGNASIVARSFGIYTQNEQVFKDYQEGKTIATYLWLNMVRDLAAALASLVNVFSPEMIILGGGMAQAKEGLLLPLGNFMDVFEWQPSGHKTPILLATQGAYAGALGAAIFSSLKNK
ncbi:ROK family protein [Pleomorphovibrio marinus]|uniref:ROK family protein n=1 Tax=Pleomorphovibrio marinus TaxID=2164132 RepID=UPI000E0A87D8|nr:ROK family protein [Pleomorphovibrio marinus]